VVKAFFFQKFVTAATRWWKSTHIVKREIRGLYVSEFR